ncbi:hypothetical protein NBRC116589_34910 [Ruegeria sp. HU-ET01832]
MRRRFGFVPPTNPRGEAARLSVAGSKPYCFANEGTEWKRRASPPAIADNIQFNIYFAFCLIISRPHTPFSILKLVAVPLGR